MRVGSGEGGAVQEEDWSGAPAAVEAMEGFTLITFIYTHMHTHTMDHNKYINRDDDTIRMLIYCS